ncbi:MAG: nucleotidyltransferase domain-containing protein [Candidatus Woesearchaeota archaeon]
MERNKIISLALNFTSFLIPKANIKKVILFGSIVSGNFDRESDIDLFIESSEKETKIKNLLELYQKTEEYEKFKLEGINNEISLKVGNLNDWKDLKRSIISNGLILYGHYRDQPEKLKHKIAFILDIRKAPRTKKIKIWRKIYGYKQKVGKKIYISQGLIEKKLGRGAFLASLENSDEIQKYLRKNKVKYSLLDIWLD